MNEITEFVGGNAWVAWVGIAVFLVIVELFSMDLVLLMFGIGALAAAVVAAIGAPLWVCIAIFAVVSLTLLSLVRPPMIKRLHNGPTLTSGFGNLVGTTGVAEGEVTQYTGRIHVGNEEWTARTYASETPIEAGAHVTVTEIDGATAVVIRKV